jgi:hypothetical protein
MWKTFVRNEVPSKEKRPSEDTEEEVHFKGIKENRIKKIAVVYKVNDRLSDEEDKHEYYSQVI